MKSVYEASTSLDAHMILDLLNQKGIEGRIDGELLQGGVGELQAINIVRVLVNESDYSEARKVVENWEATQPENPPFKPKPTKPISGLLKFFAGLLIGVGGMYLAYNHPVRSDGIDYDGDGVLDEKWTYKNYRPSKIETDRNFDGKVDFVYLFDHRGWVKESKADDNFDGVFETKFRFKNGNVIRQFSDLDNDGKVDYLAYYKDGVLSRTEIRGKGAISSIKRQTFKMDKLVSSEFDSDGDGVFETQYEYDYFEEPQKISNK